MDKNYFRVSPFYICKSRHKILVHTPRSPFGMVKYKALRRPHALNKISRAVRNKQILVDSVRFANKSRAYFTTKIKKSRTLAIIFSKRHVARLFLIIPGFLFFMDSSTENFRPGHSKRLVFTDTAMERTVEQLYRSSELSIHESHLPSACTFESLII